MAFIGTTGNAEFSGLTWTGRTKVTDRYDSITGIVFSDQAGNLNVDHSVDGINWDVTDTTAVPANTGTKVSVNLVAAFVRVRFVATTTQPTTFRCGTKLAAAGDS
jgi:Flp pilus assembly protein TadG